ncbi:MAG: fucose isomerase [Kiritimatiellae bacterium]|nr:fucose isomerase [Kiritimatiellia bacterium]MDD5523014.1 fucose isomerase [Kiritimatiellia bacterium]
MINTPDVRIGIVGVSRDCFPRALTQKRIKQVVEECQRLKLPVVPCSVIIETEKDAMSAVREMAKKEVDAVAIYLGNFGPEGPTTIFARKLGKPFMLCAASEESKDTLVDGRGDAYCGMLNAALNCGLRNLHPYIPDVPVGMPGQVAQMIASFVGVARVVVGVKNLKAFSFGPRPQDFYACNAPIKPLYNLGIEVMENSELDMLLLFKSVADRKKEIKAIAKDMAVELGAGSQHPGKLLELAQFELALMTFFEQNLGSCQFGVYANKCWPAFARGFGFVPCYVNSRLASHGIPVACEVDIYGAVSEYMCQLASMSPATLLDINNTVPDDLPIADLCGIDRRDLFMGFHCGNTASCCLCDGFAMKFQFIMHRLMEPGKKPNITCGTLEGTLRPGPTTIFRLQGTADCRLCSYVAEGEVLDADPASFGGIGIIGIPGMTRFYRHVMLEKQFPHHSAVAFEHVGRILFDAVKVLGVEDVSAPRSKGNLYPGENPFGV